MGWKVSDVAIYFKFHSWLLVPCFIIVVTWAGIAIAIIGGTLVMNSGKHDYLFLPNFTSSRLSYVLMFHISLDICLAGDTRSPEGLLEEITSKTSATAQGSEVFDFYVINGCDGEFYFQERADMIADQTSTVAAGLESLLGSINLNQTEIESGCGLLEGGLDSTKLTLNSLLTKFIRFSNLVQDLNDATQCEKFNSIFIIIFHKTLCGSLPRGLSGLFGALIPFFLIGMFMALCRGAFLSSELIGGYESQED